MMNTPCMRRSFLGIILVCILLFYPLISKAASQLEPLPERFDLRNVDGAAYIGPVKNQGPIGSCYGFAAAAAAEGTYNRANNLFNGNAETFSESFIIWSLSQKYTGFYGGDGANYDYDELQGLVDYGIVRAAVFPYVTSDPGPGNYHWDAPRVQFAGWHRAPANDIDTIKRLIKTFGAVDAAVLVDDDFGAYAGGIFVNGYTTADDPVAYYTTTNHSISLIGWDDAAQVWILRNSWGSDWGEAGYMRIGYQSAGVATAVAYLHYGSWTGETFHLVNAEAISAIPAYSSGQIVARGIYEWGGNDASITNSGSITAIADVATGNTYVQGIFLWAGDQGLVENQGTIESAAATGAGEATAYGISLQGNRILNTGTITARAASDNGQRATAYGAHFFGFDSTATFENRGTITTEANTPNGWAYGLFSSKAARITNSGTITATASDEAYGIISDGSNTLVENTYTINATATATQGTAIGIYLNRGSANNQGTINALSEGAAYGIVAFDAEGIANTGEVKAVATAVDSYGIYSYGTTLINNGGSIFAQAGSGGATGLRADDGDVINDGSILAQSDSSYAQGVAMYIGGTLTNNGTISGVSGSGASSGVVMRAGNLVNYGTIAAFGNNGIGVAPANQTSKSMNITNSGTISGGSCAIMTGSGKDSVTVEGGVVAGGRYAIYTGAGDDTVTVKGGEISGRIDMGEGMDALTVSGNGNAQFNFSLNRDTASSAQVANAETVTIADDTSLAVRVAQTSNIKNNDQFLIVDATTLTVDPLKLSIINDNALPMFSFAAGKSGNQLLLTALRDGTFYRQRSGNASLGTVLDDMANTATGDMAAVLGALDRSGNAANARKLEPNVNQGVVQASFATAGQYTNTVMGRIGQVLAARTQDGSMTGGEAARDGVWALGFGSYLHQGTTTTSDGYTANVWGVSLGYDSYLFEKGILGFSIGYARNNVTTNDVNTRTDADSYQGSIYGSLAGDAYYLNAVLSFAYNRYDAARHIAFSAIDRTAKSHYGGEQYSGYLEGGYAFKNSGFVLTPLISLEVMRLYLEDYEEMEAGTLNLNVDRQRYNLFQTGLGAKASYPIRQKSLQIIPELHAKWLYDFAGDAQQATSTFTGGGASFVTRGFEPPRSSGNVGAKLTIMTQSNWTVSVNYDLEMKTDFYGHNGWINVRFEF